MTRPARGGPPAPTREERTVDLTQKIIDALNRTVAGREDHVYDEDICVYVRNGHPSCLWGHVFIDLGMNPEELSNHENATADVVLCVEFTEDAPSVTVRDAARRSQEAQDGSAGGHLRKTWGEARDTFLRHVVTD